MNHVLIIGFVWPEPKSSAAGSRMMQLIRAFQSQNYTVTFASPCAKTDNAFDLESIGVKSMAIELNNSSFDDFIKELRPDIVLFDRFMMEEQFGWRIAEHCPDTLRVLDTEDLHCLRKGRQNAYKDNAEFDTSYLFNDIAKREIASIYRCDLSLIISEFEIELLQNTFKIDKSILLYLPFMLDQVSQEAIDNLPKYDEREHFITIGNFLHEPNFNAVLYLKETIWPLIRKQLPQVELHVYGAYAFQKVNDLHNQQDGFLIKGFAEDVNDVMRNSKVCLAPIRFGAGLKGKLIDAMTNGTPFVTTSIGAEGLFVNSENNENVTNDHKTFANIVLDLYNNNKYWQIQQRNGFEVINERFNKMPFQNKFINRLETLKEQINTHRLNNFTGAMIQHHTMQSTKFMSRWIEEKNKG